jgi:hypothetical protein
MLAGVVLLVLPHAANVQLVGQQALCFIIELSASDPTSAAVRL